MRHKVGAYVRVSTEEQAQVLEGSLDSQRHRLKTFVELKNVQEAHWGKIVEVYADEGLSAKDTKRPALQRLLADMRAGKVNLILVTDLSRLSRNILDFCLLLEDLRKHNGKFLSVKEQFDTTTAAGEMMVFNMINLAQFERKQTAERVSQNFHSRAMRGLLNGSPAILGYDKKPDKPSEYVVNEQEDVLVRDVFRIFLEQGSLARTAKHLNESGIPRKVGRDKEFRLASNGIWSYQSVRNVIENKAYIGIREVNKKYKDRDPSALTPWQQYKEVKAAWPAIVAREDFEKANRLLVQVRRLERPKPSHENGSPYLLTGLLKCVECGAPFVGEISHGRMSDHRYYGHKQYLGVSFKCAVRRFPAELAEEAVEKHLAEIALNPKGLESVEVAIGENVDAELADVRKDKERIAMRLRAIDQETSRVFRMLGEMTEGPGLALVKEQIETLGAEKAALTKRGQEIASRIEKTVSTKAAMESLNAQVVEFKNGWRKGSLGAKKRLLRAIIERLEVRPGALGLYYLVPSEQASEGAGAKVYRPDFAAAKETAELSGFKNKKAAGTFVIPTASFDVEQKIGVPLGN